MMIRPRSYSSLNRAIAKTVSHSVNNYYRQKNRQNKYNTYSGNKNSNINRSSSIDGNGALGVIVFILLIVFLIGISH